MTRICVSLIEETTAGMLERMQEMAGVADLFEVRADRVLDLDLLAILRGRTRPVLLTCRSASEGGGFPDQDPRRRQILMEAARRGFDYVDVELQSGFTDVMHEMAGHGLVVSHHDLEATPGDLEALYARMCGCGADVAKIAVTPRTLADVGRLLAFTARVRSSGGVPLVAIALGPLGAITRITAGRYGAPFTFAASDLGSEAAPGQIPAALMADLYRVRDVTPATAVYGILGSDVQRSLSPALHNRAFEAQGIDAVYVPLQADGIDAFIEALPALDLAGFSITRPYKVDVLRYVDVVEPAAARCGSVNTVVRRGGRLHGSTTDGAGVVGPLARRIPLRGRDVVILGAGGAARSAAFALAEAGAEVTILARRAEQAGAIAVAVGCRHGSFADLPRCRWGVVINATPLGSAAFPDQTPLPAELHRRGSVAFDMVYDPLETRFLREAQAAGATILDGLEMLLAQAALQFETWTGRPAPLQAMKAAALFLVQEQV